MWNICYTNSTAQFSHKGLRFLDIPILVIMSGNGLLLPDFPLLSPIYKLNWDLLLKFLLSICSRQSTDSIDISDTPQNTMGVSNESPKKEAKDSN